MPGVYVPCVILGSSSVPLGSNNNWQSFIYIDLRKYVSITNYGPKNILCVLDYYWTSVTPVPYLDLPSIGMDPAISSRLGLELRPFIAASVYFESEFHAAMYRDGVLGFVVFTAGMGSSTRVNTNR